MITYEELLQKLFPLADEKYRAFHKKLLKDDAIRVIGIRTPQLRKIAKEYRGEIDRFLTFPDEYYEVTWLKCAVASLLPYTQFVAVVDHLVGLLDNWATCDMFAPACINKHRDLFRTCILRYLEDDRVFVRRFALTTLLHFYVIEEELPFVLSCLRNVNTDEYYVSMAAAWLCAEVLVKFYDEGKAFLMENSLSKETLSRAVRKACESLRLTDAQKNELRALIGRNCHKKL